MGAAGCGHPDQEGNAEAEKQWDQQGFDHGHPPDDGTGAVRRRFLAGPGSVAARIAPSQRQPVTLP